MVMQKQDKSDIQSDLERRILKGLSHEWDAALWRLGERERPKMKKPIFSLKDLTSRHGYWSADRGEICLSRTLVMNHSWDSVVEVLKHEMAHQFADQCLHARYEADHGPSFLSACRILRANPRASGKYPALDEQVFNERQYIGDKRLMRIKKLMALAESRNQNEAEAAMAKAHELIAKYNLELIEQNQSRTFYSVFLGKPKLRHARDAYQLGGLICDFYGVEGIWAGAFVIDKGEMGSVLEISGTLTNIQIAAYAHDFVINFINSKWKDHNGSKNLGMRRKTDFACSTIKGFRSKMAGGIKLKDPAGPSTALMKIDDPMLTGYFRFRYPRISKFYRNQISQDRQTFDAGVDMGKSLVISKGICSVEKSPFLIGTEHKPE